MAPHLIKPGVELQRVDHRVALVQRRQQSVTEMSPLGSRGTRRATTEPIVNAYERGAATDSRLQRAFAA
jgi:hypothetical protein